MNADLRLALPVCAAWVATAVLVAFPSALGPAAIASWAVALLCAVGGFLSRGRWGARVGRGVITLLMVAAACAGLVFAAAAGQLANRSPRALERAASAGSFVHAEAVTNQTVHPQTPRFTATLTSVTVGGQTLTVDSPVTIFAAEAGSDLSESPGASTPAANERLGIGTTIGLSGTIAATDPGDDVAFLFFASRAAEVRAGPPWYLDWATGLRAGFADAAAALPGDGGDLLPGLAIGDTSAVSGGLGTAMKSSSLSHLTAVSGANCAVVIALVMAAGAALGLRRGWRVAAALVVLVGFVVLVTPQPSVLRAAVMAGLVLAAMATGRPVRGVPILALAVLLLLVANPWLARNYGFVLSVLATGGLLLLARPLAALLSRWLPASLAAVIAIPLAAQLACQPVLILLNPSIPLYAVPANVLAEPAAPVATVLGLMSCLLMPWLPGPGILVARLAWLPSSWIAGVARFFDGLPGKSIPWVAGAAGVALVATIILLALVIALARDVRHRRWRRIAALSLALVLVGYGGVAAGDRLRQSLMRPQDWQIAACDIGQGDAVLVRSAGRIALIDTGPDPALLQHCLDTLGIARIDLLVLSHYDLDHVGGTSAVVGLVDRVMIGPPADDHDIRLAQQLREGGAVVNQVARGETGELGELRWTVLWPPTRAGIVEPGNDSSVTLEFTGVGACESGCLSALFLGDLGDEPQARMLAANRSLGHLDVVKVAHHGSADQDPDLYERIAATVGVISVGAGNRYGHPTDTLLQILKRVGTIAERTDRQGMVLISPRADGGMSVWSERPASSGVGARE